MFDVELCEHLDEVAPRLTLDEVQRRTPDHDSLRPFHELNGAKVLPRAEVSAEPAGHRFGRREALIAAACAAAVFLGAILLTDVFVGQQVTETNNDISNGPEQSPSTASLPTADESTSSPLVSISVAPGLTVEEMIARIAAQHPELSLDELQSVIEEGGIDSELLPDDRTAIEQLDGFRTIYEGLLRPGAYQLRQTMSAEEVVRLLVRNTERELDSARFDSSSGVAELSPYEVVIVASLIESEAIIDADRTRVARVIYNRLEEGMSLGLDSTTAYAARKAAADITVDDLASTSPFNTRSPSIVGLPPTPISAPSPASIRAALSPEDGEWLFYVRTDEGGVPGAFTFASTEEEFLAAVETCRQRDLGC